MAELVVRAASFEAVKAAAQNGAGGVKLRPEGFTPPGVRGISLQELGEIVKYCRVRGVKVYITPGPLMSDADVARFGELARGASAAGADAIVAESFGAADIFRRCAPDMPCHGGFGMDIHCLDGVLRAREAGLERVCLSPLLERKALRHICAGSSVETEIKVQGSGCPAYGGGCRMGAFMDQRRPGFCAGTCREPYGFGMPGNTRPLSMKEISLGAHLPEIMAMAPAALSIDSFTASPEYAALAARYYSRAMAESRALEEVERENLKNAFCSQGCTDGLFTGEGTGAGGGLWSPGNMFFAGEPEEPPAQAVKAARESYQKGEAQRVGVRFFAAARPGAPLTLSVEDAEGHICTLESAKPLSAAETPAPPKAPEEAPAENPAENAMENQPENQPESPAENPAENPVENPAPEASALEPESPAPAKENAAEDIAENITENTTENIPENISGENAPEPELEAEPVSETQPAPEAEPVSEAEPEPVSQPAPEPEPATVRRRADTALEAELTTLLYKTRGTPYRCVSAAVRAEAGAAVSAEALRALRDKALEQLSRQRAALPVRAEGELPYWPSGPVREQAPGLTVSVQEAGQLSRGLAELKPALVCLPLFQAASNPPELAPFLKDKDIQLAVSLPRVIWDSQRRAVDEALDMVYGLGIDQAEIFNPGHAAAARARGFRLRAGLDMDCRTSAELEALRQEGWLGAVLPVDMEEDALRRLDKTLDCELTVYGRTPLLVTEACLMVERGGGCACGSRFYVTDADGANYPVLRDGRSCRSVLYSAKKLYLADRPELWKGMGLWGLRLAFTTENPAECREIAKAYLGLGSARPNEAARGLYQSRRRTELNLRRPASKKVFWKKGDKR